MTPQLGPPQLQLAVVYMAPMPASHQGAFQPGEAPVAGTTVLSSSSPATPVVYRARSPEVPALGGYGRSTPVTIWAPPASPLPAPYQLAQVAASQVTVAAPPPFSSSSAAMTKGFEHNLFVMETALASPAAAASAASAPAGEVVVASDKDLALVCKKHPARSGYGAAGKKLMIRANHFLVNVADNNLFHYDDQINWHALEPESKLRTCTGVKLNSQASVCVFCINTLLARPVGNITEVTEDNVLPITIEQLNKGKEKR